MIHARTFGCMKFVKDSKDLDLNMHIERFLLGICERANWLGLEA